MDPESKTKILTILNTKLPHQNSIDNLRFKVDDGAEVNILPLDSFGTMFPHALNKQGYPKDGLLRGSRTNLECYNDGRLLHHGSIKLRVQHYSDKSFQDHYFYVVETKMTKEIIIRHAASTRLGLICVLCKHVSKSISAMENKTNTSSRDSFQDHCLKINGKTPLRNQRVAYNSSQDHPSSSFKTMAKYTCTNTPFKTSVKDTQGMRQQDRHKSTPFKTISVDGISVIREKDNANQVSNMVKKRGRETSFKTMTKSGRKRVSFQNTEHEVSKVTSFKTIDNSGTKRVSFKTIEETNNRSIPFKNFEEWVKARTQRLIPFKTFDEWAKARRAKHDMALKDASSFI